MLKVCSIISMLVLQLIIPTESLAVNLNSGTPGVCCELEGEREFDPEQTMVLQPGQSITIIEYYGFRGRRSRPKIITNTTNQPMTVIKPGALRKEKTRVKLDPLGVLSFKVSYEFDPSFYVFRGIEAPSDFGTVSYDLSRITEGLILDIAGQTASGQPSSERYIVDVLLESNDLISENNSFSNFALRDDDFIRVRSADGQISDLSSLGSLSDCTPVPGPLPILGIAVAYNSARRLKKKLDT